MSKFKRFIYGTDNHGDLGCPIAIKKFLEFRDDWKPHYSIHGGDLFDFGSLRRGASAEDKADGISEDYSRGMEFLERYLGEAKGRTYLTLGNHDDRIWMNTVRCADGILRERCQELAAASERRFKHMKINWVPYHVSRYIQLPEGGPKFIHGFRSTQYPAKAAHDDYGPSISGHVHKPSSYHARHIDGSQSFTVGCLADIEKMTYADRYTAKNGWRQGWLYGYINTKTGKWQAWNVIREQGSNDWHTPMGVR
tara:strand:- start:1416 stop:2171 length:756 start_codon:yes stop_codon:yes gene_type:complete